MKLHAATPTNSRPPAAGRLDRGLILLGEGAEPTVIETVDGDGRAEVKEWLDAVALCFALPERNDGRRWFDI